MKKGIIVASFGTTYHETRERTIGAIETRVREEFPLYPVERAFTSGVVIKRLKEEGIHIEDLKGAMEKLDRMGVSDIYVQPLHIIPGIEYEKVLRAARDFMKTGKNVMVRVGKPLLWDQWDYSRVVDALAPEDKEARVFMGHGTRHSSDLAYEKLESLFRKKGYEEVFVGSLEGGRILEDIREELKGRNLGKVLLKPFMLVAGDHVENDMVSGEDSWKEELMKSGLKVDVDVTPLGEVPAIQEIFLGKLREVLVS